MVGFVTLLAAGSRWMIVPLGVAVALTALTVALRVNSPSTSTPGKMRRAVLPGLTSCVAVTAAVAAGGAAWALPDLELPPPSGEFGVGTSRLQWDTEGPESLTADPSDTRVLVAQLWYPTWATGAGQPYLESSTVSDAIAAQAGLPGFLLDGVVPGNTNAIADAPRADGSFPLVLFSPGLGGVRTQNSAWAEELASHGYIVAAVDHPYDSAAVVLEDGTVIGSTLRTTGNDTRGQRIADGLASIRANDLISTLDRLEEDLDVDGVATAGHSIGGAAAILAIVAGEGTGNADSDERYDAALTEVLATCGTRVVVQGAKHLSFTDAALFLPPLPSLIGSEGRTPGLEAATEETLMFLDRALGEAKAHCDE